MANKWIVTKDNRFISGNVTLHKDLRPCKERRPLMSFAYPAKEEEYVDVCGGGWYESDRIQKKVWLYSKSMDYGRCSKEQVIAALENSYNSWVENGYEIYFSHSESLLDAITSGELLNLQK